MMMMMNMMKHSLPDKREDRKNKKRKTKVKNVISEENNTGDSLDEDYYS